MSSLTLRRTAALLLIAVPIAFTALFTFLQVQFEYPDILRQPTADVLVKFQAGGPGLVAAWYGLVLTAVLFIPVVLLLHRVLAGERAPTLLWIATTFGVVAGVAQALGFLRWPFLVPYLAEVYLSPATGAAERAAAAMVFEAFHRYAGMAVGEHLGYLSTSVWTLLVAALLRQKAKGKRQKTEQADQPMLALGLIGMALALGIAAGLLEPAGVPLVGAINAISYLAWALWLVVLGVALLVRQPAAAPASTAAIS